MRYLCFITQLKKYYKVPWNTSSGFDYSEPFPYSKSYFYETNIITDYYYLILCAVKKRFLIVTKLFRFKQYKYLPAVLIDMPRVR
jgi:hypothetical protein